MQIGKAGSRQQPVRSVEDHILPSDSDPFAAIPAANNSISARWKFSAGVVFGLTAVALIGVYAFSQGSTPSLNPQLAASQICKAIPRVGAAFTKACTTPAIQTLRTSCTALSNWLCGSTPPIDPKALEAVYTAFSACQRDLAKAYATSILNGTALQESFPKDAMALMHGAQTDTTFDNFINHNITAWTSNIWWNKNPLPVNQMLTGLCCAEESLLSRIGSFVPKLLNGILSCVPVNAESLDDATKYTADTISLYSKYA